MTDYLEGLQFGLWRRLPTLRQTETAECGLACLAMIASYHGHLVDVATLRRRFPVSLKGTTLRNLIEFANELELVGRPVRIELHHLDRLSLPCILHWNLNHFVVLRKVSRKYVIIHDPARGVRRLQREKASRHFTGVALELAPAPRFERKDEAESVSLRSLIGRVIGLKRSIAQIFVLSVALEALAIIAPLFQQWIVDGVIVENDRELLIALALGLFLTMLVQMSITVIRSWLIIYLSTKLSLQWTAGIFSKLMRLNIVYFERRRLGDIVSRFGAAENIRQTLTSAAVSSLLDGIMAAVALAIMFIYDSRLPFITLTAVLLYILSRVVSYGSFKDANQEQIIAYAKQQSHFLESIRGIQSLKLFGKEDERRSQWLDLLVNSTNRSLDTQRMMTFYQIFNGLIFGSEAIVVLYCCALLVMDRKFSVGMMYAYISYKTQFSTRVSSLIDMTLSLKMLKLHRERLGDIVLGDAEQVSVATRMNDSIDYDIELRSVSFRHSVADRWVLLDVNIKIEMGEHVAIVGPSGCGKTTLLKIISGLLVATKGEISIGGIPIGTLGARVWRQALGVVMQDDQLFAGSIADNVSFFDSHFDLGRVEEACRLASIHNDILKMPMGYETLIGDMGTSISGGQKQRLLLARALYKRPRILLLDEATSHLDMDNEEKVSASISDLPLTRIVIAHRLETIAKADRVIRIEDGRVVSDRYINKEINATQVATVVSY